MKSTFQSLSRTTKIAVGGGAAVAGYLLYKNITAAQTQGATTPDDTILGRVSNATTVLKEHAIAAKDDIKKEAAEVATVMRTHASLASRDLSTASTEMGKSLRGEGVDGIQVRDTPPVVLTDVDDNVRKVAHELSPGAKRAASTGVPPVASREVGTRTTTPAGSSVRRDQTDAKTTIIPGAGANVPQGSTNDNMSPYRERSTGTAPMYVPNSETSSMTVLPQSGKGAPPGASSKQALPPVAGLDDKGFIKDTIRRVDTGDKVIDAAAPSRSPAPGPSGYEPATFAESPRERMHSTTYSNRSPSSSVLDRAHDSRRVLEEHARGASRDISQGSSEVGQVLNTHSQLAKRDLSQAGKEVKEALSGNIPRQAVVRDTPDLLSEPARDRTFDATISAPIGTSASQDKPGIGARLKATGQIIGEHAKAAKDDIKQVAHEASAVISEHAKLAKQDVRTAGSETKDAARGEGAPSVAVRDTPPLVGSKGIGQAAGSGASDTVKYVPK